MFCTKCGNQVPDGTTVCPKCGANLAAPNQMGAAPMYQQPVKPAEPFNLEKFVAKFMVVSKSVNYLTLIVLALAFISTLLPAAMYSGYHTLKAYNLYSLSVNMSFFDFYLPIIFIPLLILVLVLTLQKKDMLAMVVSAVNAIFTIVFFIILCTKLSGTIIGFGFIMYLIFALCLVGCSFLWPMIRKNMEVSKQNKAMMAQQQAMYAQQQPAYGQQQAQQYAQAPQQPQQFTQAPQQPQQYAQAPQQPQQ